MLNSAVARHVTASVASLFLVSAAAPLCSAQQPQSYAEIWSAKIKSDRVAEFGALCLRVADANRRGKGDNFTAYMNYYGADNRVYFVSPRASIDEVEPASAKFNGAIKEYLGFGPERFGAELSKLVEDSGSELRRRRLDLSSNIPDADTWMKAIAQAQYLYSVRLRVKPGRSMDFEKQLLMLKEAAEKGDGPKMPVNISQEVAGPQRQMYYATIPLKNVAEIGRMPSIRSMLGDSAYENYSQMSAQNVDLVETVILRAVPEWSNVPQMMADANPRLWKVKSAMMAKPKPAEAAKPAAASEQ
jgi:hypothetical protein